MSAPTGRAETTFNAVWRLLARLAVIGLTLFACWRLRSILTTLAVAAIIAYVLDPVVEWLARRPAFHNFHAALLAPFAKEKRIGKPRMKRYALRVIATLYVFILAVGVLWKGTGFIVTPFVAEIQSATSPEGRRQALENKEKFLKWYDGHAPAWAKSDKVQETVRKSDFSKSISGVAAQVGGRIVEAAGNIVEVVLLPVLAFYFIIDGRTLKREFVGLLPRVQMRETLRMLNEFNRIMRAFVAGQFLLCLLAGVVVGVGLALLHVKYPVIMGVIAGLTRAIPIIGPILGGIPIIILTLATKGFPTALAVLAFFTFLHFAESKFIMPMLIGDRMELHPVIIIVVLLVGGELGGLLIGGSLGSLLGMFFAAPVAALLRVMVRRYWLQLRDKPSRRAPVAEEALAPRPASAALPEIAD